MWMPTKQVTVYVQVQSQYNKTRILLPLPYSLSNPNASLA